MEIKNKNYYIRCQSCVYFQEIGIKKGNEVTVGELNCTCENVEEMLNDFTIVNIMKNILGSVKNKWRKIK